MKSQEQFKSIDELSTRIAWPFLLVGRGFDTFASAAKNDKARLYVFRGGRYKANYLHGWFESVRKVFE